MASQTQLAVRAATVGRVSPRLRLGRACLYLVATLLAAVLMVPFFWTLGSALKRSIEMYVFPPLLFPAEPQWGNFVRVWTEVPFDKWLLNTVVVVVLATTGTVLSSSLVAYSFARFRYPGRELIFLGALSTMMLPTEVTLIPTYLMYNYVGWLDTFLPLIVPTWFGTSAFNVFLLRQFFLTIPPDLDESAKIDGADTLRILWSILIPLSKPALGTVAVLSFIWEWSNFMFPLIILSSPENYTLALGLRYFQQMVDLQSEPRDHLLMAASLMVSLPTLTIFFLTQKYFVRSIVMTGLKG